MDYLRCGDAQILFIIKLSLTDLGIENWKDVPPFVMEYLGMLRRTELNKGYWEEYSGLDRQQWEFLEKGGAFEYSENLAEYFGKVSNEYLLNWNYRAGEWCPERIRECLEWFTVDNSNILVSSKRLVLSKQSFMNENGEMIEMVGNLGKNLESFFGLKRRRPGFDVAK